MVNLLKKKKKTSTPEEGFHLSKKDPHLCTLLKVFGRLHWGSELCFSPWVLGKTSFPEVWKDGVQKKEKGVPRDGHLARIGPGKDPSKAAAMGK